MNLQIETTAKCIVAGEHAVLRGFPALVLPVKGLSLNLRYSEGGDSLKAEFNGSQGQEMRILFWGVLERALELAQKKRSDIAGCVELKNEIPIGSGLGASAALSVAVSKLFLAKSWITESEIYEFARQLENLFHGESSGVDIAACLHQKPIHFVRGEEPRSFSMKWTPYWYLSYSGSRGMTSDCVRRVKALLEKNPELGHEIDEMMGESVLMAEGALQMKAEKGFSTLADSLNKSRQCFERWGLVNSSLGRHMTLLMEMGAVAVKPTGSGDGGYVLSLWSKPQQSSEKLELIGV